MGKATVESDKYSLKRRLHKEYRDKMEDGKYYKEKHQRDDTSTKYSVSKSSRSFADDVKDASESDKLARRHRHHHHRHHRHHNSSHSHSRHHHRHRERNLHEPDDEQQNNFTPPKAKTTVIEIIDDDSEATDLEQVTQVSPAVVRLNSPGMLSVSSSHSSLSTTHYSHSPAVIVDSETTHGHNSHHSSPDKNSISNSKRTCNSTPSPKRRSRSNSVNLKENSDSESSASSSSQRSKKSRSSNSSSNSSSSESASGSGSDTSSDSNSSRSDAEHSTVIELTQLPEAEPAKMEGDEQVNDKQHNEIKKIINGQDGEMNVGSLPDFFPGVSGCRSVEEFQCLNRIEEGTYGVVYRAKDKKTEEHVALKRLKMEKETEGFPITSLREINTLLKAQHPNIVTVREIVVGSNMDQIFIVMDYVEHDMKSLMQTMRQRKQSFLPSEIKCLTQQLLRAVAHLHDNWILHRDLKTSNLLLSHKGILKVADFGLAREYGSPLKNYTPVVVTLWYRAPELLLCSPLYSTSIDMWSVGCIFAEWLLMRPLFTGEKEIDQLNRIFKELGTPNEKIWKGYTKLPGVKNILSQNSQFTEYPISSLRKRFTNITSDLGINLLQGLLTYDPEKRLTAERALNHEYFSELPLPIEPSMFPTWPAKSELGDRKKVASPKPPPGGSQFKKLTGLDVPLPTTGAGFQLKF